MDSVAIPRRVRTLPGRILVLAFAVGALLLGACSRQTVEPVPWTPTPSPVPTTAAGCGLQQLPASWQLALKPTTMTPADQVDLLAHDATTGRSLYVRLGSPLTVVVADPGGAQRTLFELRGDEQPYGAAIEGDWAVLAVGGMNDLSVHAVYAKRVTGGDQVEVAAKAADGAVPLTSTPILYKGVAYVQVGATGAGGETGLTAVDLATGQRTTWSVPRAMGEMARFGDLLVWRQGTGSAAAVDLRTQQIVDVPAPLSSVGDSTWVSSDGETVVWQGDSAGAGWLRACRSGWTSMREDALPGDATSPSMTGWGRYAVVFMLDRFWIVDVETGQYAPTTIEWGGATVSGGLLATAEMASEKGGSAGLRELDLTKVPTLPACTR